MLIIRPCIYALIIISTCKEGAQRLNTAPKRRMEINSRRLAIFKAANTNHKPEGW